MGRDLLTLGAHIEFGEAGESLPGGVNTAREVRVIDVQEPDAFLLRVGQEQGERGLVRDEGLHVPGVVGHQCEPGDCAAAAAEHVGGPSTNRFQNPADVVGQQFGLTILVVVVDGATGEASGVEGDDGVMLGQTRGDGAKPRCTHRMAHQHERGARASYLVVQARPRNVQPVTCGQGSFHVPPLLVADPSVAGDLAAIDMQDDAGDEWG